MPTAQPKAASTVTPTIEILDDIGPSWAGMIGAKSISAQLKEFGPDVQEINVVINSYGGDVFEGLTIYNLLKDHKATINVHIAGVAASIASVIAMSGDRITIAAGGFLMIHNPWGIAVGESEEMRKSANLLDEIRDTISQIYADRTGKEPGFFSDLMEKETWINAEKAVAWGLATEVIQNKQAVVNSLSPKNYALHDVPAGLRSCATLAAKLNAKIREIDLDVNDDRTRAAVIKELCASAASSGAEGLRIEAILDGKEGCQSEAALELFSKTLAIPLNELKAAHVEDGCQCKSTPAPTAKVDHKAQLAAWRLVGQRIGK